jgi:hypothetical protein
MLRPSLALALLCAIAAPSAAQAPRSIDPGMSEAKVVERLGEPDATRSAGDFKYLFYRNGCIKQCGMDDVVILQKDSVVDAMFRSADRGYTGKSSSPRAIPAEVAARTRPGTRDVPSGEVVQAGAPKDTAPANRVSADTTHAAVTTPDSATKPEAKPAAPKRTKQHSKPKTPAAGPDSTRHDTITGTLRIPVKPPIHSAKSADSSSHPDTSAKRPPHQD